MNFSFPTGFQEQLQNFDTQLNPTTANNVFILKKHGPICTWLSNLSISKSDKNEPAICKEFDKLKIILVEMTQENKTAVQHFTLPKGMYVKATISEDGVRFINSIFDEQHRKKIEITHHAMYKGKKIDMTRVDFTE